MLSIHPISASQTMTPEQILKELEQLANLSAISVRYEKGDFEGGFCILKAERLIVINKKLAPARKGTVLAQGLAEIGIEELYLKPVVREFIEDELARQSDGVGSRFPGSRAAGLAKSAKFTS